MLEQVLEERGVRTHIDDFGTGASPLRLLHRFPGDAIRSRARSSRGMGHDARRVRDRPGDRRARPQPRARGDRRGRRDAAQLDHLKVLGCEFAQGFHVSVPLPATEAQKLLESGAPSALGAGGAGRLAAVVAGVVALGDGLVVAVEARLLLAYGRTRLRR